MLTDITLCPNMFYHNWLSSLTLISSVSMLVVMSMSCISQYDSCFQTWVTKTCISQDFFVCVCVICRIILLLQQGFIYICSNGCQCTGSRLGMGTVFAGVGISVVERGWSWDHLIFVMVFPTPMGQDLYIEIGPWSDPCFIYVWSISLLCNILFLIAPR